MMAHDVATASPLSARAYPQARIMIVDDDPTNIRVIERLLRRAGYTDVLATTDALAAEDAYFVFHPDILLLDLHMPRLGGLALLSRLSPQLDADLVPVLVLTGDPSTDSRQRALSSGAKDFVAKPFEQVELLLRVYNLVETRFAQLQLRDQNQTLEQKVQERTRELANAELATLQLLARAAEFRDDATGQHTQRVGELSARLAATLGIGAADVEIIRLAAPLHDIGKIGIPDHILLKAGPLTAPEWTIMQRHTSMGADILEGNDFPVLRRARDIARSHHERWDGAGYPDALAASAIPQAARVVAVADVFDALRHDRPYRAGLELATVIAMIASEAGKQLDPEVVEAFQVLVASGDMDVAGSPSTT